jgi:HSP20 family protein
MVKDDYWTRPHVRMWPFTRRWMFGNMENLFREMEDLMASEFKGLAEKVSKDLVRERTLPSGAIVKEMGPFVYGYSMTVGPDGKPRIREFGNIKPETRMGRPNLDIKDKREPLADVLTTDDDVQVIIELPGVAKDDIKLRGTEESITVSVDTAERRYYKKLELPVKTDPKTAKSRYTNGVLEITIKKLEKEEAPEGEPIKID